MPKNQSDRPLSAASEGMTGTPQTIAAGLMGVQAVVLVVLAVMLLGDIFVNSDTEAGRSVTLAAVVLSFAVCAGFLANALRRGLAGARTPTVLWNAFLILVGFTLGQGSAPLLATVAVVVIGVASLVSGWFATIQPD